MVLFMVGQSFSFYRQLGLTVSDVWTVGACIIIVYSLSMQDFFKGTIRFVDVVYHFVSSDLNSRNS